MKNCNRLFFAIFFCFSVLKTQAQLGFCTGNSGDPIFEETFGAGSTYGRLPAGSKSSYKYKQGRPADGFYTIASSTFGWFNWFNIGDHTKDAKGRMLIVNAASKPGKFFEIPISGLCENTSYEFSSWLINIFPYYNRACGGNGKSKPINVTFEIWDSTNTVLLKSGDTGNIFSSVNPDWKQYALVFQTKPGQTSVILKMRNNGVGGCGNDLAIDDILFRTCGDAVVIEDSSKNINVTLGEHELPFSTTLKASPDYSVFSTHFYQWQQSLNGKNWTNIAGENKDSFSVTSLKNVAYYRVVLAEDAINLFNSSCNSYSAVYKVNIDKLKPPPPKPKKKVVKPKPRKKLKGIGVKGLAKPLVEINDGSLKKNIAPLDIDITNSIVLTKTEKRVIIVMDGLNTITNKVWIDGAKGRFVQTGEEIIKQGDANGGFIIEETLYIKARYGYNSIKRRYKY